MMNQLTQEITHEKPVSLVRSMAEHYQYDAFDFARRFDLLWESMPNKTGRIKSFVDLVFAFECILKCHIALGRTDEDPKMVLKDLIKARHDIGKLVEIAKISRDQNVYDELAYRLNGFSVFLRYSLDAYSSFFPFYTARRKSKLNYSQTVGNNEWVLETRALLSPLLQTAKEALSGLVTDDIVVILRNARLMSELMDGQKKESKLPSSDSSHD